MKQLQNQFEQRAEKNDLRVSYGPLGMTEEEEKFALHRKRDQARQELGDQIRENAMTREEMNRMKKRDEFIAQRTIEEVLRQEKALDDLQIKSKQELLRAAWDDQIQKTQLLKELEAEKFLDKEKYA